MFVVGGTTAGAEPPPYICLRKRGKCEPKGIAGQARNDTGGGRPAEHVTQKKTSGTGPQQDRTARSTTHVTSWVRPSKSPLKIEGVGGAEAILVLFSGEKYEKLTEELQRHATKKCLCGVETRADTRSAPTGCGFS